MKVRRGWWKAISVTRWLFENVFSRVGEPYLASHLQAIAFLAVPLTGLWAWICFRLGRRQRALARQLEA